MSDQFTQFPSSGGGFPPAGQQPGGFGTSPGGFPQQGMGGGGFSQPPQGPFGGHSQGPSSSRPAQPGSRPGPGTGKPAADPKSRRGKKEKPAKTEKPVTKRLISRQVWIAVGFAAVFAVVALVMLNGGGGQYVVRTVESIPAGSTITGSMLEAVALPEDAIEPNTYTAGSPEAALEKAIEDVEGVVNQYPIPAKAQLREGQFGLQANLGEDLGPNDRLMSFSASVAATVAGGLKVGDHVDIYGSIDGQANLLAMNVPIVSITVSEDLYNSVADAQATDPSLNPNEALPGDPVPGIFVVRLPAQLVPVIVNWTTSANLTLVYRAPGSVDVTTPDYFLTDPLPEVPVEPTEGEGGETPPTEGEGGETPPADSGQGDSGGGLGGLLPDEDPFFNN